MKFSSKHHNPLKALKMILLLLLTFTFALMPHYNCSRLGRWILSSSKKNISLWIIYDCRQFVNRWLRHRNWIVIFSFAFRGKCGRLNSCCCCKYCSVHRLTQDAGFKTVCRIMIFKFYNAFVIILFFVHSSIFVSIGIKRDYVFIVFPTKNCSTSNNQLYKN